MKAKPIFDTVAEHGEGPLWDPVKQELYWVDIMQGKYYKTDPLKGIVQSFSIGQPLGVLALREKGGLVMGVRDGFGFYDENTGQFELIEPSPQQEDSRVRFNDGAIDPCGRFFAGTMEWDGKEDLGKLFRLDVNHTWQLLEESIFVTNGMGWNNDENTYFMIDSLKHVVYAFDYDVSTGQISNRREHIVFNDDEFPDGMCMDENDNFWIALWGGKKIVHCDKHGVRLDEIAIPVLHPTSCCFGGKDLQTLYITTSRIALNEDEKNEYPLAGKMFALDLKVRGKIQRRFKG